MTMKFLVLNLVSAQAIKSAAPTDSKSASDYKQSLSHVQDQQAQLLRRGQTQSQTLQSVKETNTADALNLHRSQQQQNVIQVPKKKQIKSSSRKAQDLQQDQSEQQVSNSLSQSESQSEEIQQKGYYLDPAEHFDYDRTRRSIDWDSYANGETVGMNSLSDSQQMILQPDTLLRCPTGQQLTGCLCQHSNLGEDLYDWWDDQKNIKNIEQNSYGQHDIGTGYDRSQSNSSLYKNNKTMSEHDKIDQLASIQTVYVLPKDPPQCLGPIKVDFATLYQKMYDGDERRYYRGFEDEYGIYNNWNSKVGKWAEVDKNGFAVDYPNDTSNNGSSSQWLDFSDTSRPRTYDTTTDPNTGEEIKIPRYRLGDIPDVSKINFTIEYTDGRPSKVIDSNSFHYIDNYTDSTLTGSIDSEQQRDLSSYKPHNLDVNKDGIHDHVMAPGGSQWKSVVRMTTNSYYSQDDGSSPGSGPTTSPGEWVCRTKMTYGEKQRYLNKERSLYNGYNSYQSDQSQKKVALSNGKVYPIEYGTEWAEFDGNSSNSSSEAQSPQGFQFPKVQPLCLETDYVNVSDQYRQDLLNDYHDTSDSDSDFNFLSTITADNLPQVGSRHHTGLGDIIKIERILDVAARDVLNPHNLLTIENQVNNSQNSSNSSSSSNQSDYSFYMFSSTIADQRIDIKCPPSHPLLISCNIVGESWSAHPNIESNTWLNTAPMGALYNELNTEMDDYRNVNLDDGGVCRVPATPEPGTSPLQHQLFQNSLTTPGPCCVFERLPTPYSKPGLASVYCAKQGISGSINLNSLNLNRNINDNQVNGYNQFNFQSSYLPGFSTVTTHLSAELFDDESASQYSNGQRIYNTRDRVMVGQCPHVQMEISKRKEDPQRPGQYLEPIEYETVMESRQLRLLSCTVRHSIITRPLAIMTGPLSGDELPEMLKGESTDNNATNASEEPEEPTLFELDKNSCLAVLSKPWIEGTVMVMRCYKYGIY